MKRIVGFHQLLLLIAFLFMVLNHRIAFTEDAVNGSVHLDLGKIIPALYEAYGDAIERIEKRNADIVFTINGRELYYRDGRMLSVRHSVNHFEYDPIFYHYPVKPLREILPPITYPKNRSSDFLDALIGDSEEEIISESRWIPFLGHRVYVHEICIESLKKVDSAIVESSRWSESVKDYISNIKIIFSRDRRSVSGTPNLSYHAYGLALDIIPKSYNGKQVYWRWSSVFTKDWGDIPLSDRWQPPDEVIAAFEENGFIWGGKWYHFDTIHFEYRPEILIYSQSTPLQSKIKRGTE